jgi:phosphoribosyl 1,2-cyclic phosphate phosphodiesterase
MWLEAGAKILVDPGPDLRYQLMRENLPKPDAVVITHEHGDHFLGLDELLCYKRALPRAKWKPIKVYANPLAWPVIEERFGYLLGDLLEKCTAEPEQPLLGDPFGEELVCLPKKTFHGPFAKGAQGYVFKTKTAEGELSLGITGDLVSTEDPDAFAGLDALVCQCHFLNEPKVNRANHLSLQNALPLLKKWKPRKVYFVHISCQDIRPGDEIGNQVLKKYQPENPLCSPTGTAYEIPRDQRSWQDTVEKVFRDQDLFVAPQVAYDGLAVDLFRGA